MLQICNQQDVRQEHLLKVSCKLFILLGKLAEQFEEKQLGGRHKYISMDGRYIYHLAIIDYLQEFDLPKKAENFIKIWLYYREEYKISAVNPVMYMKRFFKFMKENVIINQKEKGNKLFFGDRSTAVKSLCYYENQLEKSINLKSTISSVIK